MNAWNGIIWMQMLINAEVVKIFLTNYEDVSSNYLKIWPLYTINNWTVMSAY